MVNERRKMVVCKADEVALKIQPLLDSGYELKQMISEDIAIYPQCRSTEYIACSRLIFYLEKNYYNNESTL